MWPLFPSLELRLKRTCSLGPGLGAAIFFFFFFPVVKEPFEGCQMQEEHTIPFFIMRLLSLSRVARVKRGAESALERSEELQKEFKKGLFFWKCSIFARCLNRVGCEF